MAQGKGTQEGFIDCCVPQSTDHAPLREQEPGVATEAPDAYPLHPTHVPCPVGGGDRGSALRGGTQRGHGAGSLDTEKVCRRGTWVLILAPFITSWGLWESPFPFPAQLLYLQNEESEK